MNHPPKEGTFKNTYVLMRHGRSIANEKSIIVSDPKEGMSGYGLTHAGKEEVLESAQEAKSAHVLNSSVIILSSDFVRARETAEITAQALGTDAVILAPQLRERFFGSWDGKESSNYEKVWRNDKQDISSTTSGVESVNDVTDRVTALIESLENTYRDKTILLVSHGDTLRILQTAFCHTDPSVHREIDTMHTAEIRTL